MNHKHHIFIFLFILFIYYGFHNNISIAYSGLFFIMYKQAIQDIKELEVSNLSMWLLAFVCFYIVIIQESSFLWIMMGAFGVSTLLFLLYKITKEKGIGGADVKFMFCCGAILGFYGAFQALFYACVSALLFHFITKFQYEKLPFIPFLAFGVYVSLM